MAITETRTLPAEFIEALGKTYADQLTTQAGTPIDTSAFAPTVAGQDAAQTQAYNLAQSGIGAYQPFLTAAGTAGTDAATTLGGVPSAITAADLRLGNVPGYIGAAGTGLGTAGDELTAAGTTLGGVPSYLTAAQGLTGTGAGTGVGSIASYMSPYQSDVIDSTLTEFDRQAAMQQNLQSQQALGVPGAFGGGREGVMQAEYASNSDRNRAAIQSGLLQQGFGQAAGLRQQDLSNQMGLGQAQAGLAAQQAAQAQQRGQLGLSQLGLGSAEQSLGQSALGIGSARQSLAQSQLGQGQYQATLGQLAPQLQSQDISLLSGLGSMQQAQAQAQIDAANQAAQTAAYEPSQRVGAFGQGVTGLMGGYPSQYQYQNAPNPSPLANALGIASTVGGLLTKGNSGINFNFPTTPIK